MSNHELYRFVPLKSAGYFTSCALKPLPQSTERIPDGPSPLIITANTPRTHQVTHFSDLWPAQSFRKWIKDCCHPFTACTQSYMKLHEATWSYIGCKHWQATIPQTHRKTLRQIHTNPCNYINNQPRQAVQDSSSHLARTSQDPWKSVITCQDFSSVQGPFGMHHGKQGGLGRTRSQKMHTFKWSPGSP